MMLFLKRKKFEEFILNRLGMVYVNSFYLRSFRA